MEKNSIIIQRETIVPSSLATTVKIMNGQHSIVRSSGKRELK
jgi:hypothetical protein